MVAYKLFYFFYQIAVPVLFFKVSIGLALGAWFLQVIAASIFALLFCCLCIRFLIMPFRNWMKRTDSVQLASSSV
jgi:hypothetical protein